MELTSTFRWRIRMPQRTEKLPWKISVRATFADELMPYGKHYTGGSRILTLKCAGQAWHTLDDGGRPNDPQLQPVLERIAKKETDPKLRQRAIDLIQSARRLVEKHQELVAQRADYFRGKCDWCGATDVEVTYDYETEFEITGAEKRFALMCADCAGRSV